MANTHTRSGVGTSAILDIALGTAFVVDHTALLTSAPLSVFAGLYAIFEVRTLATFGVIFAASANLTIASGIALAIGVTGLASYATGRTIAALFGVGCAAWTGTNAPLVVADAGLLSLATDTTITFAGLTERTNDGLNVTFANAPSQTIGVTGLGSRFCVCTSACLSLCGCADRCLGRTFVASHKPCPQEKTKKAEITKGSPRTRRKNPKKS